MLGRAARDRRSFSVLLLMGAVLVGPGCGEDDRPAQWSYLSAVILQPSCATVSCHSRAAAAAGLDFSDPDRGFTSLMGLKVWIVDPEGSSNCRTIDGQVVCQRDFRPLVIPYNPEQSRLVNMLRGRGASLMPPDRPLPEADIRLVERWIRAGAPRHGQSGADAGPDGGADAITLTAPADAQARDTQPAPGDATTGS